MSSWGSLVRFLKTDPLDAGCAETFELLERYVERELARGDAAQERFELGHVGHAGTLCAAASARKFPSKAWPCSDAMLSGWNCTP